MKKRCHSPKYQSFKDYGARGISVCQEWRDDYLSFLNWALENGYIDNLTLDRKDNSGNYSPDNCRWATIVEQNNNKRTTPYITAWGETRTITQWMRDPRCTISKPSLKARLKSGWKTENAIGDPAEEQPRYVTAWGETKTLSGWGKDPRATVSSRQISARLMAGDSPEDAIGACDYRSKPQRILRGRDVE